MPSEHTNSSDLRDLRHLRARDGFGGVQAGDVYAHQPRSPEDLAELLIKSPHVSVSGAGRSYGDATRASEQIAIDLNLWNDIFELQPGLVRAGAGVTIEQLWRWGLPRGFWPHVVSGTMRPTVAGALAMNIHGKNAWTAGPLGEHVQSLEFMDARGRVQTIAATDHHFRSIVSGAGLLGVILSADIELRAVSSGRLNVRARRARTWDDHFRAFGESAAQSDYMVSWIDGFGMGRGAFHCATYDSTPDTASLQEEAQDLPDRVLGVVPKSQVWRILRLLNHPLGIRALNTAKQLATKDASFSQSLVEFSFLLDYVPGWQRAYAKGLWQFQAFVPAAKAPEAFPRLVDAAHRQGLPPYLLVMKQHRRDEFVLSHGVDGFSLAMDFPLNDFESAQKLSDMLAEITLDFDGRFYLAKDRFLRAEHFAASLDLTPWNAARDHWDPERKFTSDLAKRLNL